MGPREARTLAACRSRAIAPTCPEEEDGTPTTLFAALITGLASCVTASMPESASVNIVTLDRPVYFVSPEGEPIQAQTGDYAVTEAEQ